MAKKAPWVTAVLVLMLIGCSGPSSTAPEIAQAPRAVAPTASAPQPVAKRITAAMNSNPTSISSQFILAGGGTIQGGDALEDLVNAGLTIVDNVGKLQPQLAEAVPTLENGNWTVTSEGRMETRWRIRQGAVWHDGVPFTTADLLFTVQLGRDRDLPIFREAAYELVDSVEAIDSSSIVVKWKSPYIQADTFFTRGLAFPRPRHILEPAYKENAESITQLPYWTEAYVGTGPFKVKSWVASSHLIAEANQSYVLGRPRVDEIEVRFIENPNALVANLLAGEVELTLGRNLSLQQAVQMRDQWREGHVGIGFKNWIALYPQQINPTPAALTNVQFRRALLHALDRQQLVDTLQEGMVPVAHAFLSPSDPSYRAIEQRIVRYELDPPRAAQLIEDLGYRKGADGVYQDAGGQRLTIEVRTSGGDDTHEAAVFSIADLWRRVGIAGEPFLIPQAQRRDREYNATYPGVRLWRLPNDPDDLNRYSSKETSRSENRFTGANRSRYESTALDGLVDRYMSTIPIGERTAILGDIVHHMTDQVTILGLWYNTEPVMIGNRLVNVTARDAGVATEAWNAHDWDVNPQLGGQARR